MVHELQLDPAELPALKAEILSAIKQAVGEDWVEGTVPVVDHDGA